jgi:hypothetical protein
MPVKATERSPPPALPVVPAGQAQHILAFSSPAILTMIAYPREWFVRRSAGWRDSEP